MTDATTLTLADGRKRLRGDEMSEPAWTTTPPTEPGKWFWRFVGDIETHVVELDEEDEGYPFEFEGRPREWWPVRIEEPPRGETP